MLTQGFIALLSLTVSIQAAAPGKIVAIQSPASFCLLLPSLPGQSIGESEGSATSHCVGTSTNGARSLPASVVKQAHYLDGPGYVQITGQIDMAALRISSRDGGGQYDDASWGIEPTSSCAGYDRYLELVGNDVFCIRCCKFSDPLKADYDKSSPCYAGNDLAGCETNIPGAYGPGFTYNGKAVDGPGGSNPNPPPSPSPPAPSPSASTTPAPSPSFTGKSTEDDGASSTIVSSTSPRGTSSTARTTSLTPSTTAKPPVNTETQISIVSGATQGYQRGLVALGVGLAAMILA